MKKTGNSDFDFTNIEIICGEDGFLPIGAINQAEKRFSWKGKTIFNITVHKKECRKFKQFKVIRIMPIISIIVEFMQ